MKISQEVRDYAAQKEAGMEQMSEAFRAHGSELYHSAEVVSDEKIA